MKFNVPRKLPEANVQAEFYHRCRNLGLRLCLEYRLDNCRFDAVMINSRDEIYAIVEFKSWIRDKDVTNYDSKQLQKYRVYGVPVVFCSKYSKLDATIAKCMALLRESESFVF